MNTLKDRKVVVVGGSSGIGLGVAAAALERGARVAIVGRSADKLQKAAQKLGGGSRLQTIAADMTDEGSVARMFGDVGALDHLVSTAGAPPPSDPVNSLDVDVARRFVDNKLFGALILAKHAVKTLVRGGSITLTSGINKDRPPVPGGSVVTAVAGSFGYLAHALALELGPTRVNVVSPGWVDTPMWDELVGEAKAGYLADMASRLPARKIATPFDVARAYIYLMENELMTGETIHIDGGQRLI